MLPNAQKLFVGAQSDLCEMYKWFLQHYDKIPSFVYTGKNSHK